MAKEADIAINESSNLTSLDRKYCNGQLAEDIEKNAQTKHELAKCLERINTEQFIMHEQ